MRQRPLFLNDIVHCFYLPFTFLFGERAAKHRGNYSTRLPGKYAASLQATKHRPKLLEASIWRWRDWLLRRGLWEQVDPSLRSNRDPLKSISPARQAEAPSPSQRGPTAGMSLRGRRIHLPARSKPHDGPRILTSKCGKKYIEACLAWSEHPLRRCKLYKLCNRARPPPAQLAP